MLSQLAGFPSLPWLNSISLYIGHIFSHLFTEGHFGYFCPLAVVNNAAINIRVQTAILYSVFISFGYIPKSRIAGSYGNSTSNFLNLHSVFLHGCVNLYSHQQCRRVFFFTSPSTLVSFAFLMIAILTMWDDISLWFWFAFAWWLVMLNIFSYTCWPYVYFLWKKLANQSQQHIKRITPHNRVGFILGVNGWFNIHKAINMTHYINRVKEEIHIYWREDHLERVLDLVQERLCKGVQMILRGHLLNLGTVKQEKA